MLDGRRFDVVYTGSGALCWLPDIHRWARTVANLLRPGGYPLRESSPDLTEWWPAGWDTA